MKNLLSILTICLGMGSSFGATFTVTNLNNAGAGSLRQAIDDASGTAEADVIEFDGVSGVINLSSGLEIWDHEVFIDGSTADGYTTGNPTIILRLNNTGVDILGVKSTNASGSRVHALHFQGGRKAIELWQVTGVTISGCWFGLTADGSGILNSPVIYEEAINVNNADDNFIGLPGDGNRNVIGRTDVHETSDGSGDRGRGINLYQSDGNAIQNNYLGVNKDGWDAGNNNRFVVGIYLNESSNNTIGSATSRSGRNIVGNAAQDGIAIANSSNNNNTYGNFVGLAKDGVSDIGCGRHGIIYRDGSTGGTIGGATEVQRNITSYNANNGLSVDQASGLSFVNNYSGTDSTGTIDYGNGWSGLSFTAGSNCTITDNLFSGNSNEGVWMGVGTNDIRFYGNTIGLDASGTVALQNNKQGIMISEWGGICNTITIGQSGQGNLISGNGEEGIKAERCADLVIKSNVIGLNSAGDAAIGNGDQGLEIIGNESNEAIVGGVTAAEGNTISGNDQNGIYTTSHYLEIHGNRIGTDVSGTVSIGNGRSGVELSGSNFNNISDNVISGNTRHGIELIGANRNIVTSNTISNNGINGANLSSTSARNEFQLNTFESNVNGIQISDANSSRNLIKASAFSCNTSKGINLNGTVLVGVGNDRKPTPTIATNSYSGNLFGTAEANDSVDVYIVSDCDTNTVCSQSVKKQGRTYVGSVLADGAGNWSFVSDRATKYYTVASRDADNNTSEFAVCDCFDPTWEVTSTDADDCDALAGQITVTTTSFGGLGTNLTGVLSYTSPSGAVVRELDTDLSGNWVIDSLVPGSYTNIEIEYYGCTFSDPSSITIDGLAFTTGELTFDADVICYDDLIEASYTSLPSYTVSFYDSIPGGAWREITDGTVSTNSISYTTPIDFDTTLFIRASVDDGGVCSGFTAVDSLVLYCPCIDPLLTSSFEDATNCDGTNGAFTLTKTDGQTFQADSTYWVTYVFNGEKDSVIADITSSTSISLYPLEIGTYSQITLKEHKCTWPLGSDIAIGGDVLTGTTIATGQDQVCIGDVLTITHDINAPFTITWYDSSATQDWTLITTGTSTDGSFDYPITTEHNGNIYIRARIQNNDCDEYSNTIEVNNYCPCRAPIFSLASENTTDCEASNGSITITKSNKEPFEATNDYWVWYTLNGEEDSIQAVVTSGTTVELSPLPKGTYTNLILAGPTCTWNLDESVTIGGDVLGNTDIATDQDQVCIGDSLTIIHAVTSPFTLVWYDSTSNRGWEEITTGVSTDGTFKYPINTEYNGNIYVRALVQSNDCNQFTNPLTVSNYCPCRDPEISVASEDASDCEAANGSITITKQNKEPFVDGEVYSLAFNLDGVDSSLVGAVLSDKTLLISPLNKGTYTSLVLTTPRCEFTLDDVVTIDGDILGDSDISTAQTQVCVGDTLTITHGIQSPFVLTWYDSTANQGWTEITTGITSDGEFKYPILSEHDGDIFIRASIANNDCNTFTNTISVNNFCPCKEYVFEFDGQDADDCDATEGSITIKKTDRYPFVPGVEYGVEYNSSAGVVSVTLNAETDSTLLITNLGPDTYHDFTITSSLCEWEVDSSVTIEGEPFSTADISSDQTSVCNGDSLLIVYPNSENYSIEWRLMQSSVSEVITVEKLAGDTFFFVPQDIEGTYSISAVATEGECSHTTNAISVLSFCPCDEPDWTTASVNTNDCFATNGEIVITETTDFLEVGKTYIVSYYLEDALQTKSVLFNADRTLVLEGLVTGEYGSISVFDGRCDQSVADGITIEGKPFSAGSISAPATVCTDDSLEVAYNLNDFHQVTWYDSSSAGDWTEIVNLNSNDDSLMFDPTIEETMIHVRAIVDSAGCVDTTNSVVVWIDLCLPDPVIFIPNIFTPNNDGTHDVLNITDIDRFEDYTLEVYNRWGSLVYETGAPYEPWNGQYEGKQLPFGVYYYILNIHDTDEQFAGHVTIMY